MKELISASIKSNSAQGSDQTQEASSAKVQSLVNNFLKDYKWLGVGLGTLTVLAHFLRIRYLPSLSVADVGLLALAILLFAILGLLAIGVICILPGTALIGWATQRAIPRPRGPANRDHIKRTSRRGKAIRIQSSTTENKWKPTGAGLAFLLIYGGFLIAFASYYLPSKAFPKGIRDSIWLTIFSLSLLTVFISSPLLDFRSVRYKALKTKWLTIISLILTTSLYLVSIPFFWIVPKMSYSEGANLTSYDITFLLAIPSIHWFMYVTRGLPSRLRFGAPSAILLYILTVLGIPFYLIDQSLRTYGVGLLENQTVLITQRGCDIAKAAHLKATCTQMGTTGTDLFALGPVLIQTRLGSHMLIADPGWTVDGIVNRVPIPASDVASWFTEDRAAPTTEKINNP